MCLLERKRNYNDIMNTKLDPHERAVTFEGKDYMCETLKVTHPLLFEQINRTVKRIIEVSNHQLHNNL
jgi:hypothetical protein